MKKLSLISGFLLISVLLLSQSPSKFNYQAVIRDASGNEIINQLVSIQISLLQTTATGASVYVEQFKPTTNDFGLITLEIGTGTVQSGVFANIDWTSGPYFLKIEVDEAGGSSYVEIGTSQLLSVPYALHAETVDGLDQITDAVALKQEKIARYYGIVEGTVSSVGPDTGDPFQFTFLDPDFASATTDEIFVTATGFMGANPSTFDEPLVFYYEVEKIDDIVRINLYVKGYDKSPSSANYIKIHCKAIYIK